MHLKTIFKFVVLLFCILCQSVWSDTAVKLGVGKCYNHTCPDGTFSCKKHSYVSKDKNWLLIDISCLGSSNEVLDSFSEQEVNPYDKSIFFEGYSYSGLLTYYTSKSRNNINDNNASPKYPEKYYKYANNDSIK